MRPEVFREKLPLIITSLIFLALYAIAGARFENFLTLRVFLNLFTDNAHLGLAAIGMTFVILSGGIDLSVGSVIGCTGVIVASILATSNSALLAILCGLGFGLAVGLTQGYLIARFRLAPFLVTLGGLFFCRGLALAISEEAISISHPVMDQLIRTSISLPGRSHLTLLAILMLLVAATGMFIARKTRFGRTIYAIGSDSHSAELMGLPVKSSLIRAYGLSGLCSALGGVVFCLYTSSGNPTSGTALELDAIAAVVIGGTLLTGGYGSVLGSLIGTLILGLIQTILIFDGSMTSWWAKIFIGALLLLFLAIQKGLEALASRSMSGKGTAET